MEDSTKKHEYSKNGAVLLGYFCMRTSSVSKFFKKKKKSFSFIFFFGYVTKIDKNNENSKNITLNVNI
jgi:hypothetical protein